MSLANFIRSDLEPILSDWERFAATLRPAATYMDAATLRDYAEEMLLKAAEEIETSQDREQQAQKARGEIPGYAPDVTAIAKDHAAHRLSGAFTLEQVLAEFRALRASVILRWSDQLEQVGPTELSEVTRFNESIDQLLTESLLWYDGMIQETQKRLNEMISQGVNRYPALIDLSPDATLIDVGGRLVHANPAAAQLLGAGAREAVAGRHRLDIVDPEHHELFNAYIQSIVSGKTVPLIELRWRRLDGTPLRVEVAAGPLPWDGDTAVQIVARDISGRRPAGDAPRDANRGDAGTTR